MNALLLAPHSDDEALFACYLCLAFKPHIVICTVSQAQESYGVSAEERASESLAVADLLGCACTQLDFLDTDRGAIRKPLIGWLELHRAHSEEYDVVFAPAVEEGGNEQHSAVGEAADEVYGEIVVHYLTYTSDGRSRSDTESEPRDPDWIGIKLEALSRYRSQLRVPNCRPWFFDLLDLREWLQ